MLLYFIILFVLLLGVILFATKRAVIHTCGILYFITQALFIGWLIFGGVEYGSEPWGLFVYDSLGLSYGGLMSLVGGLVAWRSIDYLNQESLRHVKFYFISLLLLSFFLLGVFLSANAAVSWIFMEATTLAAAGLIYHRRTVRALEATWKYVFVSSIGLAVAYLGVMLLSTVGVDSLNYNELTTAVMSNNANPIYMKIAFLFIMLGYSTKMEIFPLFTVGVDANHSTPTPSSAFLSSAMVGGGFVAIYRVYKVFEGSEIFGWIMNLLILCAIISLICSAVYMARTGNFKRLLAYSTVEHSGLVLLGLGLGGVGVYAALLHSLSHTIIKAVAYLQFSVIGRFYRSYKIGRIGGYIKVDRLGSIVLILCVMSLIAAPPSVLFVSEFLIFNTIIESERWWLLILILLPLLGCAYWALTKLMWVVFGPIHKPVEQSQKEMKFSVFSLILLILMVGILVLGVVEVDAIKKLIVNIESGT